MTKDEPGTRAISANVRAEIARAGRTQRDIAEAIGLTYSQWQRRMSGTVKWRIDELQRIARHLSVPLPALTGERGDGSQ